MQLESHGCKVRHVQARLFVCGADFRADERLTDQIFLDKFATIKKSRMNVGVMHLVALAAACVSNAAMALVEYRRQFGFPLTSWSESYFGDIAGIEGLLGIKYEKKPTK